MNLIIKKILKWSYLVILVTFSVVMTVLLEPVTYNDISSDPQYSKLINTEYKTTDELYIYGIRENGNAAKILDYYDITEVNFSGPEVSSKDVLKKGTILKIKRVEKARDFFIKEIRYAVDINPPYENTQKTIYIDLDTLNTYSN